MTSDILFRSCRQKQPWKTRIATLWDRSQTFMFWIIAQAILLILCAVAWLNDHLVLIAESLEKRFGSLVQRSSAQAMATEPRDLESGPVNWGRTASPDLTTGHPFPATSNRPRREGDQMHSHENGLPTHPYTEIPLPPNRVDSPSETSDEGILQRIRYFSNHTIRNSGTKFPTNKQPVGTDESSLSWKCRGAGRVSTSQISGGKANMTTGRQQAHMQAAQWGPTGSHTTDSSSGNGSELASEYSSAAVSTDDSGAVDMTSWTVVEIPFRNRRLSFWNSRERRMHSRAIRAADCQREQSHALRKKGSDDSFESLDRYVAAYDEFISTGSDPRDKFKYSREKPSTSSGGTLKSRVFSPRSAAQTIEIERPLVFDSLNWQSRAKCVDPKKSSIYARPRSLSVGAEPGRFSSASLDTVYQYDPESNTFFVRWGSAAKERPPTVIRNFVEANSRQITAAQRKLAANGGRIYR